MTGNDDFQGFQNFFNGLKEFRFVLVAAFDVREDTFDIAVHSSSEI